MSKLPHVFSDASVTQTQTVLSVVSSHLGIKKQIVLNKVVSTHKAEELALLVAKKLTLGTKCMYFTDNLHLAYRHGHKNFLSFYKDTKGFGIIATVIYYILTSFTLVWFVVIKLINIIADGITIILNKKG